MTGMAGIADNQFPALIRREAADKQIRPTSIRPSYLGPSIATLPSSQPIAAITQRIVSGTPLGSDEAANHTAIVPLEEKHSLNDTEDAAAGRPPATASAVSFNPRYPRQQQRLRVRMPTRLFFIAAILRHELHNATTPLRRRDRVLRDPRNAHACLIRPRDSLV